MINKSECDFCKKTVLSTPMKDLCEFYFIGYVCLCESCLKEVVYDWFEQHQERIFKKENHQC